VNAAKRGSVVDALAAVAGSVPLWLLVLPLLVLPLLVLPPAYE
jgi:hypothetical protein